MPFFAIPLTPKPIGPKQYGIRNYFLGPCETGEAAQEAADRRNGQMGEPCPHLIIPGEFYLGRPELEAIDERAAGYWDRPDQPGQ
jgi:hypothetical protein